MAAGPCRRPLSAAAPTAVHMVEALKPHLTSSSQLDVKRLSCSLPCSNPPPLPTAVHTLEELKLSGNHLKGSRPVLSFDKCVRHRWGCSFDAPRLLDLLPRLLARVACTRLCPCRPRALAPVVMAGQCPPRIAGCACPLCPCCIPPGARSIRPAVCLRPAVQEL